MPRCVKGYGIASLCRERAMERYFCKDEGEFGHWVYQPQYAMVFGLEEAAKKVVDMNWAGCYLVKLFTAMEKWDQDTLATLPTKRGRKRMPVKMDTDGYYEYNEKVMNY